VLTLLWSLALTSGCGSAEQTSSSPNSSGPAAVKEALQSGEAFEGTITMRMETPGQNGMDMTYFIKGERSRIESQFGDDPQMRGVMLWDLSVGKMTTLIPQQKMYMTMDFTGLGASVDESTSDEKEPEFPKLTATGKKETIAGFSCEHYLIGDKQDVDLCVAKGLGYFGMGGGRGIGSGAGSLKNLFLSPKLIAQAAAHPEWIELLEGGAFPLKMTMTENGQVKMQMEATRIERKKLEDELFTVPADYKELSIPGR
jgi:hypothetical protein